MASGVSSPRTAVAVEPPIFRGYALVYFTCAWLVGDWLSGQSVCAAVTLAQWIAVAVGGLALAVASQNLRMRLSLRPAMRRALRISVALGAACLWIGLGAARATAANPAHDPRNIAHFADNRQVEVVGQVVAEPDLRDGYEIVTIAVNTVRENGYEAQPSSGRIDATIYGPNDWFMPTYGDTVTLTGVLKPVLRGAGPTDIEARISSSRAQVNKRGGGLGLLAMLYSLRLKLAQAIERTLPGPEAALLIGILLGMKSPALRARLPLFINTGTIHLIVPAGLKVSLLAELTSRSVRRLGVWPQTIAALLAVGAYAALGGGGPAAIRAAIMGALLALAPALGRTYNVYTALALATLVMTLIEPAVLYDAGFQLTVLATFALPLLTPALQGMLTAPLRRFGKTSASQAISESLAVTLAAQIATLPVLALTFHVVSIIAPVANLLTVPFLAPLLTFGGLLALFAVLGWSLLATALAWVVWPLLWIVNAAISACASAPLAALQTPTAPALLAPVYYAILMGIVIMLAPRLIAAARAARDEARSRGRTAFTGRAIGFLVGLALLGSLGASAPAIAASQRARLDFLDVGPGGSAILLHLPNGSAALIDGGPSGPTLESALSAREPFWMHTLSAVVLTDTRAGDARGVEDIASQFAITHALDAGMRHPTPEYVAYLDAMRHAGATRQQFRAGDALRLGDTTTLIALSPPTTLYPPNQGDTAASDDLILRLETPGLRVLFLGAADGYALDALSGAGEPLDADVVEVAAPRGAALDLSGPLGDVLRLAHPRVIIVCDAPVAPKPRNGATLSANMWASDADVAATTHAQVYRLSATGALSLSGDANGWTLG